MSYKLQNTVKIIWWKINWWNPVGLYKFVLYCLHMYDHLVVPLVGYLSSYTCVQLQLPGVTHSNWMVSGAHLGSCVYGNVYQY